MVFNKNVVFLGISQSQITKGDLAGHTMYNVQLFDQEGNGSVGLNVMDMNEELVKSFSPLSFGVLCNATFDLRPEGGYYKVRLRNLVPVSHGRPEK